MRRRVHIENFHDLARRAAAGESVHRIAIDAGVSYGALWRRLRNPAPPPPPQPLSAMQQPLRGRHVAAVQRPGESGWRAAVVDDDGKGGRTVRTLSGEHPTIAAALAQYRGPRRRQL